MANITVTTAANFIPEVWSKEVQMFAKQNYVLASIVKNFNSDVKKFGDVLHIPKVTRGTAAAKSADTDVTFTATTEGVVNLTIDKHYYVARVIEDIVKVQNAYDQRALYTEADGEGIAKQIDTDLAALYAGLSQSVDSTGALTDANLLTAIQYLDDADAPMSDRHFVFKPIVKKNILALDKFVLYQNRGNSESIGNGEIGEIYGIKTHVSTNIAVSTTARNLLLHKEAFALAMQLEPRVQAQYAVEKLGTKLVTDAIYGVVEYRDAYGVEVKV